MVNVRVPDSVTMKKRQKRALGSVVSGAESAEIALLRELTMKHVMRTIKRLQSVLDQPDLPEHEMAETYTRLREIETLGHKMKKDITQLRWLIGLSETLVDRLEVKEPI